MRVYAEIVWSLKEDIERVTGIFWYSIDIYELTDDRVQLALMSFTTLWKTSFILPRLNSVEFIWRLQFIFVLLAVLDVL